MGRKVESRCPNQGEFLSFQVCAVGIVPYTCFQDSLGCTAPGVGPEFSDCNQTVRMLDAAYLPQQSCENNINQFQVGQEELNSTQLTAYCDTPVNVATAQLCDVTKTCPSVDDLETRFVPLIDCLVLVPAQLSDDPEALEAYRPWTCLLEAEGATSGIPDVCDPTSNNGWIPEFKYCQDTVQDVIQVFYQATGSNSSAVVDCTALLRGEFLTSLCDQPFSVAAEALCTEPSCSGFFDCPIAGLEAPIFLGIVGAGALMFVGMFAGVLQWRRASSALVKRDSMLDVLSKQNSWTDNGPPVVRGPSKPDLTLDDPRTLARRKKELIAFYKFNDPNRPDIEGHVETLFAKYTFENIARAIQSKYGMLPAGWADELVAHSASSRGGGSPGGSAGMPPGLNRSPSGRGGNASRGGGANHPKYAKYDQMAKAGLPEGAIRHAMEQDGVDASDWTYYPPR